MRDRQDKLTELNVAVLIVTYEPLTKARAYREETNLKWPLLVDESRSMYSQYGMGSAGWPALISPRALMAYTKLLLRGRRLAKPGSDIHQLGGDVLIDPQGVVRLCHVSSGPADRPAVGKILNVAGGDES